MRLRFLLQTALLAQLALATSLFSQVTGRLTGTVLDQSGASVQGAKVVVINQGTGAQYGAETNSEGVFVVPQLVSGRYTVRVEMSGFHNAEVKDVKVDAGKEYSLPPIRLEVGAVQETVTVSAGGANLVQTSNAVVTSSLYTEQIKYLPLAGRNPMALLGMQAGAGVNGRATTNTVINGTRSSYSNVTIDGINVQDNFIRSNDLDFLPNLPFLGQVAEITIVTSTPDASSGNGSSQVVLITPSGSNVFHGEAFWYNRTSATAANNFFNNASRVPKAFRLTNQFGGSVGGPILRDKLFFYVYFDGSRQKLQSARNTTILLPNARQGIFTYRDSAGNLRQLDVLQTAGVTLDPFIQKALGRVPTTVNFSGVGDGLNTSGFRINQRNNRTRDNVGFRMDYNLSERHSFTGTYSYNRDILDRPGLDRTFNVVPVVSNNDVVHFLSTAWRWNPTPRLTNELRGGFNRAPVIFNTTEDFSKGPLIDRLSLFFTNPVENFRLQGRNTNTYQLMDNAAWQHGTHALRFGWQSQWIHVEPFDEDGITPVYSIGISSANTKGLQSSQFPGGVGSGDLNNANSLLAALAGFVTSATQTFNVTSKTSGFVPGGRNDRHNSLNSLAFYGTDQWRLRRNLTLNAGLRWEYLGRYDERDGLMLYPVIQNGNILQTLLSNATVDFAGAKNGRPIYAKDLNNFAPSLGLAWDPRGNGKTSLRLGYTLNYVNDEGIRSVDNAVISNAGLSSSASIVRLMQTISGGLPAIPTPAFRVPRLFSDQLAVSPTAAGFAVEPQLAAPYVQQWTVSVQRQLPWRTSLDVRYVGNHGTHLYRGIDFNQVIIGSNGFLDDFIRARNNGFLSLARGSGFNPDFNSAIPGSQQLTVFPQLELRGLLTNATVRGLIQRGEAGDLAAVYFTNGFGGSNIFVRNPNIFVADLVGNNSSSSYHSLQVEVNRRIRDLFFNANYTWSKVLTDAAGTGQTRFDPYLDLANARLERARADYDQKHAIKGNFLYELPFGGEHRLTSSHRLLRGLISGWQMSSFVQWLSGPPFSILAPRGTLNRASGSRSAQNTATTSLNAGQINNLLGIVKTGNAVYYINPSVIGPDGRGVAPDGSAPFSGQVFRNPGPGQLGVLQRRMFDGPAYFNWDYAILKKTNITETKAIEFRVEFFNLLNNVVFANGNFNTDNGDQNVNSTSFGKVTSLQNGPRFLQTSIRFTF